MYIQSLGFLLDQTYWREVDRQYTLYLEETGKVSVQARGVRKMLSKLRSHMQPFALVEFNLVQGKYRHQLTGARIIRKYSFEHSQARIGYGFYFLELINHLTRDLQVNQTVFDLLLEAFELLEEISDEQKLKQLRVAFLLKMLQATGFSPEKRGSRDAATQVVLETYLNRPLTECIALTPNGEMKTLFTISQFTLNEVIERPMQTVRFIQTHI